MQFNTSFLFAAILLFAFVSCSKPVEETEELSGVLCFRNEYASQYIEIVRVKPDGSDYKVLLHDELSPSINMGNELPRLSFDRKSIVFTSARRGSATGFRDIFIMNADGTGLTNLTNTPDQDEYAGGLSPVGNALFFYRSSNSGGQFYLMDRSGSNVRQLTSFSDLARTMTISKAVWCGDGRTILFAANKENEITSLYSIQADGTGLRKITNTDHPVVQFSVTRDGQKIAFSDIFNDQGNYLSRIYTINADGTDERFVLQSKLAFDPTISPDGKYIAYFDDKAKITPYDGLDVYIVNADGTNRKRITYSAGNKFDLDWK